LFNIVGGDLCEELRADILECKYQCWAYAQSGVLSCRALRSSGQRWLAALYMCEIALKKKAPFPTVAVTHFLFQVHA
jgi:hypothetical protein